MLTPSRGVGGVRPAAAEDAATAFEAFTAEAGPRLRRALVARWGVDVGADLAADALAYAWEHWGRVAALDNPVGYLFRVATSAARRHRRWRRQVWFPPEAATDVELPLDVGLDRALAQLGPEQRTCVVLVHVFGWSYAETADVLEVSVGAVRNHLHRGLRHLRELMEGR